MPRKTAHDAAAPAGDDQVGNAVAGEVAGGRFVGCRHTRRSHRGNGSQSRRSALASSTLTLGPGLIGGHQIEPSVDD